jgi:hypothetical protein
MNTQDLVLESSLRNLIDLLTSNNSIKHDIATSKHTAIAQLLTTSYQQIYDIINDHSLITTDPFKSSKGELYAQLKLYNNGSYQCSVVFKQSTPAVVQHGMPGATDISAIIPIEHDTFVALKNAKGDVKQIGLLPIVNDLLKISTCDFTKMDIDQPNYTSVAASDDEEEGSGDDEDAENDIDDGADEPDCRTPLKTPGCACSCQKYIYKPIPVVERKPPCGKSCNGAHCPRR